MHERSPFPGQHQIPMGTKAQNHNSRNSNMNYNQHQQGYQQNMNTGMSGRGFPQQQQQHQQPQQQQQFYRAPPPPPQSIYWQPAPQMMYSSMPMGGNPPLSQPWNNGGMANQASTYTTEVYQAPQQFHYQQDQPQIMYSGHPVTQSYVAFEQGNGGKMSQPPPPPYQPDFHQGPYQDPFYQPPQNQPYIGQQSYAVEQQQHDMQSEEEPYPYPRSKAPQYNWSKTDAKTNEESRVKQSQRSQHNSAPIQQPQLPRSSQIVAPVESADVQVNDQRDVAIAEEKNHTNSKMEPNQKTTLNCPQSTNQTKNSGNKEGTTINDETNASNIVEQLQKVLGLLSLAATTKQTESHSSLLETTETAKTSQVASDPGNLPLHPHCMQQLQQLLQNHLPQPHVHHHFHHFGNRPSLYQLEVEPQKNADSFGRKDDVNLAECNSKNAASVVVEKCTPKELEGSSTTSTPKLPVFDKPPADTASLTHKSLDTSNRSVVASANPPGHNQRNDAVRKEKKETSPVYTSSYSNDSVASTSSIDPRRNTTTGNLEQKNKGPPTRNEPKRFSDIVKMKLNPPTRTHPNPNTYIRAHEDFPALTNAAQKSMGGQSETVKNQTRNLSIPTSFAPSNTKANCHQWKSCQSATSKTENTKCRSNRAGPSTSRSTNNSCFSSSARQSRNSQKIVQKERSAFENVNSTRNQEYGTELQALVDADSDQAKIGHTEEAQNETVRNEQIKSPTITPAETQMEPTSTNHENVNEESEQENVAPKEAAPAQQPKLSRKQKKTSKKNAAKAKEDEDMNLLFKEIKANEELREKLKKESEGKSNITISSSKSRTTTVMMSPEGENYWEYVKKLICQYNQSTERHSGHLMENYYHSLYSLRYGKLRFRYRDEKIPLIHLNPTAAAIFEYCSNYPLYLLGTGENKPKLVQFLQSKRDQYKGSMDEKHEQLYSVFNVILGNPSLFSLHDIKWMINRNTPIEEQESEDVKYLEMMEHMSFTICNDLPRVIESSRMVLMKDIESKIQTKHAEHFHGYCARSDLLRRKVEQFGSLYGEQKELLNWALEPPSENVVWTANDRRKSLLEMASSIPTLKPNRQELYTRLHDYLNHVESYIVDVDVYNICIKRSSSSLAQKQDFLFSAWFGVR